MQSRIRAFDRRGRDQRNLVAVAVSSGCYASKAAEHPREMLLMGEAASQRDLGQTQGLVSKQRPGALYAQIEHVLIG